MKLISSRDGLLEIHDPKYYNHPYNKKYTLQFNLFVTERRIKKYKVGEVVKLKNSSKLFKIRLVGKNPNPCGHCEDTGIKTCPSRYEVLASILGNLEFLEWKYENTSKKEK